MTKRAGAKRLSKHYVKFEVDWPNRFRSRPLPFQTGDKVKTPNGIGVITAVGQTGLHLIVYRVGRKQYWYGFQLSLLGRISRAALKAEVER